MGACDRAGREHVDKCEAYEVLSFEEGEWTVPWAGTCWQLADWKIRHDRLGI